MNFVLNSPRFEFSSHSLLSPFLSLPYESSAPEKSFTLRGTTFGKFSPRSVFSLDMNTRFPLPFHLSYLKTIVYKQCHRLLYISSFTKYTKEEPYTPLMIIVNFFKHLRTTLGSKQLRIHANEISILELLQQCETQLSKSFLDLLINPEGKLLPGMLILVNGQNVLNLQGIQTIVRNGANVAIFPPD